MAPSVGRTQRIVPQWHGRQSRALVLGGCAGRRDDSVLEIRAFDRRDMEGRTKWILFDAACRQQLFAIGIAVFNPS